ncbi:hypothetical protein AVEN_109359-1 [Araneus ventricosus]|uniref:Mariner Mos1 transposase n=1 Tax=Araneus ventricosus TaxID=182803 RepID=A0A4Y2S7W0_ARAVE|nr:hypothetical protein AVEN_109359-1 [Araneus ventricosus]
MHTSNSAFCSRNHLLRRSRCSSPRKEKFRLVKRRGFSYEFIPEGQTVNKELYLEILKRLRDAVRRKRPEKWATNNWFLLHDNAPPHRALIVKKYLPRHSFTTLEHPLFLPT